MDPRLAGQVSIADLFDQFIDASTMMNVLSLHHRILNYADLSPCEFNIFYPKLKQAVLENREMRKNWKAKALFSKIDKKSIHRCYSNIKSSSTPTNLKIQSSDNNTWNNSSDLSSIRNSSNNALKNYSCLVIGSGPAGLRTAIELQFLGASKVLIVEKRNRFSRNNVLHLWPFVIDDLKSLGAKKFYGKFCAGSIDHISIRQLQLMLLKICLMIGCDFRESCSYLSICPASIKQPNQNENQKETNRVNGFECRFTSIDSKDFVNVGGSIKKDDYNDDINFKSGGENVVKIDTKLKPTTIVANPKSQNGTHPPDSSGTSGNKVENNNKQQVDKECGKENNHSKPTVKSSEEATSLVCRRQPENLSGVRAHFKSEFSNQEKELHSYEWDIIIGADGRRNTLSKHFPRKEFRGRLAIAITANFINRQTPNEAAVSEISGLSYIYNQDMFNALALDTNIVLENICYYKDDTHYFVMTAKKISLLEKGVLKKDYATTQELLSESNIDRQALLKYAKDAASWTTGLEPLDFAVNHYGQEDCAMFDFTSMYAASNACKALRTIGGGLTLTGLVGDSLLEPFWPTGSGCGRGFLSSFDAAWMCRQWAVSRCAILEPRASTRNKTANSSNINCSTYDKMALNVIAERESIYRILGQTTSENLQSNYSHYTLIPHSRYPNLNKHLVTPHQVEHLLSDNEKKPAAAFSKERSSRNLKSPTNRQAQRRSPKRLKAVLSPNRTANTLANSEWQSKDSWQSRRRNKAQSELRDDVESSLKYQDLYTDLSYGRAQSIDNLYTPTSLSGTNPSASNLLNLEARKTKDIDDCLRYRRQKTQLSFMRENLSRNNFAAHDDDDSYDKGHRFKAAELFKELRRIREQQDKGADNHSKEIGPLAIFNSMRRCVSFAERVKSFEEKLGPSHGACESAPVTPKINVDNVRNLPQFATLQELFVVKNAAIDDKDSHVKKSKIPIMKLTKDDWNVKCWEDRLAAYKGKNVLHHKTVDGVNGGDLPQIPRKGQIGKANSVDLHNVPEKKIEVFQDRIKEMAEKLKIAKDSNQKLYGSKENLIAASSKSSSNPSRGWIDHLKRELTSESLKSKDLSSSKFRTSLSVQRKPIKKLFEDDDEDDTNKHFDHLCVNKQQQQSRNKYLAKNIYTSHLSRTRYNGGAAASAINKTFNVSLSKLSAFERKDQFPVNQAAIHQMSHLTSKSAPLANTTTTESLTTTSGNKRQKQHERQAFKFLCVLCNEFVRAVDKLAIGDEIYHRSCLCCCKCGVALRRDEIELEDLDDDTSEQKVSFTCRLCEPRNKQQTATTSGLTTEQNDVRERVVENEEHEDEGDLITSRLRSRQAFLEQKVNYNELYKRILDGSAALTPQAAIDRHDIHDSNPSPIPIQVTLPKPAPRSAKADDSEAEHEVEQEATVRLPRDDNDDCDDDDIEDDDYDTEDDYDNVDDDHDSQSKFARVLIDEDELNKLLHLDNTSNKTTDVDDYSSDEFSGGNIELGVSCGSSSSCGPSSLADYDVAGRAKLNQVNEDIPNKCKSRSSRETDDDDDDYNNDDEADNHQAEKDNDDSDKFTSAAKSRSNGGGGGGGGCCSSNSTTDGDVGVPLAGNA